MTVASLNDVLQPAMTGNYAVAGLVVLGWEDAKAFVEAAEEAGLPVVLQAGPGCRKHTPVPILGKMFRYLAEQATVPVVCHIDHARSLDECRDGIDHGFSSVMIDGSMLPLAENIALTASVVELAKSTGVSVEGEVGVVGYANGAASLNTSPEDAARFVRETGVDALAISIGNVHLQTDKAAEIDWAALKQIEALTNLPLVLHGGSGIPSDMRRRLAMESRVKKFNIGTELRMAFGRALRNSLQDQPREFDRIKLLGPTIQTSRRAARDIIVELGKPIVAKTETGKVSAESEGRTALVVGTYDTKGEELNFIRDKLRALGIPAKTVDVSTSGILSMADIRPDEIASLHSGGAAAVFTGERGQSVSAMAEAFARWIVQQREIGGIISAGGSGGTTLATAGMRKLPVGIPKLMVSTVASGEVGHYVGPSDIMMLYSVADVQGINPISEQVLSNAANALAGMIRGRPDEVTREAKRKNARPTVGLTMFGVTTPCIQAIQKQLEADYDCLIFHATGAGGRSMENLVDSGLINALMDITTTEVADLLVGGVFPADADRFGSAIRTGIPYVGSVGALDMVNFGPRNTVPEKFNSRTFVVHNSNVTLMRTTRDENRAMGQWIAERLNEMEGPVRFLLPEGGVSLIDAPGKPFHDPEADNALFEAIEKTLRPTSHRTVERVRGNINDPLFVEAALAAFASITPKITRRA